MNRCPIFVININRNKKLNQAVFILCPRKYLILLFSLSYAHLVPELELKLRFQNQSGRYREPMSDIYDIGT